MKIPLLFCSLIFAFIFCVSNPATAANTYIWLGGTSTAWTDVSNWSLNGFSAQSSGGGVYYPGQNSSTDIVVFGDVLASNNTPVVTTNIPNNLAQITVNDFTKATITINSGFSLSATSLVVGPTFGFNASLTLATNGATASHVNLSGGSVNIGPANGTSNLIVSTNTNVSCTSESVTVGGSQSSITNSGTISLISSSAYSNYSGGYGFINNTGGTFSFSGCSIWLGNSSNENIVNAGSFSLSTSNIYMDSSQLPGTSGVSNFSITNTGTFTSTSSNIYLTSTGTSIKNLGTFAVITSSIYLSGTSTNISNSGNFLLEPKSVIYPTGASSVVTNNSGSTFTLMSDNTGSAAIGALNSTASLNGIFNIQRYITGSSSSYSGYRLLSSPVNCTKAASATSSSTLNYISLYYLNKSATVNGITYNGIYTGGSGGTAGGFDATTTNPILYFYNETLKTSNTSFTSGKNVGISYINVGTGPPVPTTVNMVSTAKPVNGASYTTPSNLPIPVGNGFIDYFIGPNTISGTSSAISAATITNIGYINQQNVTVYLWYTPSNGTSTGTAGQLSFTTPSVPANPADKFQGFNMVGNPYPSTLNLAQVFTDNSGIDNIYVLSDNTSTGAGYNVYTATGNSSPSPAYVVSGQGFLVHAKSGGQTLVFQEGEKAPTQQLTGTSLLLGTPKSTDQPLSGLYMKLAQDSITYDYCGIYFRSDWVSTFKTGDAIDLDGLSPKVYMSSYTSDGVRTAVNHQPDYTKGVKVKLYADAISDGIYSLNIEGIRNIDTLYDIFLIDHYKQDSLDMRRYSSYAFNIYKSDTSSFGGSRFELSIHPRPLPPYKLLNFAAQKASESVQLTWKTENEANYTGFVLQKQDGTQFNQLNSQQSDGSGSYTFVDHNPILGSNTYRLQQSGITGSITYSSPVTIMYSQSATTNSGLSVYPNPVKDMINLTINQNSVNVNSANGSIIINPSAPATGAVSYSVKIMTIMGTVIASDNSAGVEWHQNAVALAPGSYIIQVINNKDKSLVGKSIFVKI